MTVKELVEHLKFYNGDAEVFIKKLDDDLVNRHWAPLEHEDIAPQYDHMQILIG